MTLGVIPPKYTRPSMDESDLKLGRGRGDSEGQVRIFGFFLLDRQRSLILLTARTDSALVKGLP